MSNEASSGRTRQLLSEKEEYIGWRTITLLELMTNKLTKDFEGTIETGKENEALTYVLKSISFKLLSGIPPDHLVSVASVLNYLKARFGDNNVQDLSLGYRKTRMFGIYPQTFITKLDAARNKVLQAGGKVSIEGQLDIIFENIHQEFYAEWIRKERLELPASVTQSTIEKLLLSLKRYYDASPPVLRAKFDNHQNFKAHAVKYNEKERPKCSICGRLGHEKEKCWKAHPELHPYKNKPKVDQSGNKEDVEAYFDSCANKHFFKDAPADLKPTNAVVYTADGTPNPILHYGKMKLGQIYVDNVFHQPKFQKNLVSGIELMKEGYKITMEDDKLKIEREGKTFATGSYDPKEDLIKMDDVKLVAAPAILTSNRFSVLEETNEASLMNQRKGNIRRNNPTERSPLEIIELDIQGPFRLKAHDGSSSNLKLIDKATGYVKMELIQSKSSSNMKAIFERYQKRMERQCEGTIKRVRTDADPSFYGPFLQYLESNGIIKEKTPPYIHHLPSSVERVHQTITSMSRVSLESSNLPSSFYGFAMEHSVFVYNRKIGSKGKSPYELLFGRKPSDELVPFGTVGYAFIPLELRENGKLTNRRTKVRMLTFGNDDESEETFGWQVIKEDTGDRFYSNDVIWKYDDPKRPLKIFGIQKKEDFSILEDVDFDESEPAAPFLMDDSENSYSPSENVESNDSFAQSSALPSTPVTGSDDDDVSPDVQSIMDELDAKYGETIFKGLMTKYAEIFQDEEAYTGATGGHQMLAAYCAMHANMADPKVPKTFKEAMSGPNAKEWKVAMEKEMSSLKENGTWTLGKMTAGKKAIKCKWVYAIKYLPDGSIQKFKARLVAKGFTQKEGIDYNEIFSPVSKLASWRLLICIAAAHGWKLFQDDVPSAFLKGILKEEIFMDQAEGFEEGGDIKCHLKKTIYGLKQSAREWNQVITDYLKSLGFKQVQSEPCLFVRNRSGKFTYCVIWVDDILTTGDDAIDDFRKNLQSHFKMDDGSELNWCLGLHVNKDTNTGDIFVDQDKYIKDKMVEFKDFIKPGGSSTPLPSNYKDLLIEAKTAEALPNFPYAPMLGSLMYAMLCTRPDICAAISFLARNTKNPSKIHCQLLQHVFRYCSANPYRIRYKSNANLVLKGWVDAAYANNNDCNSTGGYVFTLGSGPISWATNKQSVTALSSSEAEYMAVTPAGQECLWLRAILQELEIQQDCTILHEDNQAVIHLSKEPKINKRTKHIDVRYHWIRQKIAAKEFCLKYCPTKSQLADIMTKIPPGPQFHKLVQDIGMSLPLDRFQSRRVLEPLSSDPLQIPTL